MSQQPEIICAYSNKPQDSVYFTAEGNLCQKCLDETATLVTPRPANPPQTPSVKG